MSFSEEQRGIYFMGGKSENYQKELFLPENPFTAELEKQKTEKAAKEAAELFLTLEKEKQAELNEQLQDLEILPMSNKVMIMPYPVNPYRKVVEGSIIVDFTGSFDNPDSGEKDKLKELVGCAKVIEVGPDCKYLKPGDDVYYDTRTTYPVPFMSLGYKLTSEPQILCVLSKALKERFKMN